MSQHTPSQPDVVIVGGGIAGLTLALALQDHLQVVIIESQPWSAALQKSQVYALSLLSSRIFQGLGIWQTLLPLVTRFQNIRLSDGDDPAVVKFMPLDLNTEDLGYVAEHRVLAGVLQNRLTKTQILDCTSIIAVEYQHDRALVQIKTPVGFQTFSPKLVVAADGAKSPLREAAGITTRGWRYWQSCITVRVQPEDHQTHTAYEKFHPSGPFAILPLPGGVCNVVWTSPHAEAEALAKLDEAEFLSRLHQRYGPQMGKLHLASGRSIFQVQLMHSDRYISHRLALIGDAAHCCHPVGGQGLNMGIRDAAALAEVILNAQGQDFGRVEVLQHYERWRRPENWVILAFTDLLDRLFSNQWLPLVWLRRLGLQMMRSLPPLRRLSLSLMTGLLGRSPRLAR